MFDKPICYFRGVGSILSHLLGCLYNSMWCYFCHSDVSIGVGVGVGVGVAVTL